MFIQLVLNNYVVLSHFTVMLACMQAPPGNRTLGVPLFRTTGRGSRGGEELYNEVQHRWATIKPSLAQPIKMQ